MHILRRMPHRLRGSDLLDGPTASVLQQGIEPMPYANISEVNACLEDCIEFCKSHQDTEYCANYGPQLEEVRNEIANSWEATDKHFSAWRRQLGEDKLNWKHLAKLLREVQQKLERIDAIGYPDKRVMYWDEPLLEQAARAMIDYLEERGADIDFAADDADRLAKLIDVGHDEHEESSDALRNYTRHYRSRRDSLSNGYHVIGEFRDSMRRNLGKDHPDYQSIRWAWSVSPDEAVL